MKFQIIIPNYNQSDLCTKCLKSIKQYSHDYQVIFVDNGSEEKEFQKIYSVLKTIPHILVRNQENLGFVKAVNQGLKLSSADYIVIMNNDTEAVKNWLDILAAPMESDPLIAATGPRTTTPYSWQGCTDPGSSKVITLPPNSMLAFFCVMIRKSVIDQVGLLDEAFGIGFGDDDDYCARIQKLGYVLAWCTDIIIPHHHRATFKKLYSDKEIANMQQKNLQIFLERRKSNFYDRRF